MLNVHELSNGDLFVLSRSNGSTLYEFDHNVFDGKGVLLESKVRVITVYWPDDGMMVKEPAQWIIASEIDITRCNPYAVAKPIRIVVEDLET